MTVRAEHVGGPSSTRYRVRIPVGRDPLTGKKKQQAAYFHAKNQREANRLAPAHEAALRSGAAIAQDHRGTVGELVDLWERHRAGKDSPTTVYRRRSILATIRRDLGAIRLADLKPLQIDQWYDQLRAENIGTGPAVKRRSEATVHHYHRVLHAILQQGYAWELTDRTPAARATAPKNRRHATVKSPPAAVVRLLLEEAPPNLGMACRMLAATGARRGEVAALRWSDIDLEAGTVSITKSVAAPTVGTAVVKEPKNDASIRQVRIDAATVVELDRFQRRMRREWPDLAPDAFLFPDPHGFDRTGCTEQSPDWISRGWRALCAAHGAKIRLHDLRHFHASTLLDAGVPLHAVKDRLGHALASTTSDIYGHTVDGADEAAALVIQLALEGPKQVGTNTP